MVKTRANIAGGVYSKNSNNTQQYVVSYDKLIRSTLNG